MTSAVDQSTAIGVTDPIDRENMLRIGRAWIELRRGTGTLRDYMFDGERPLEMGQMDALDLLARGERTMSGLAERLRIDPSTATRVVQRLISEGLAERAPSPDDGRVVLVHITGEGRRLHARADARRSHAMSLILGEFDAEERCDLAALLGRFVEALDQVCDRMSVDHA